MTATLLGSLRKRLTTPDTSEIRFTTRGFDTASAPARAKLEHSALQFLLGYEFGIEQRGHEALVTRLEGLEREYQGFAYEGAAMALTIRDVLRPTGGNRLVETFLAGPDFTSGPGSRHIFMAYIGVGFALARLPRALWRRALPDARALADHPALNWLIMDGYGFHMAFFDHRTWVEGQHVGGPYPWPGPADYTRRVVDQGVGRGMWFTHGGDVERLLTTIEGFPPERRADLVSGAALAVTYAGGVEADQLEAFAKGTSAYRAEVGQGAVFALRARAVADLVTPHHEAAARLFCRRDAHAAAELAAAGVVDLRDEGRTPAYEVFRQRVMRHFA
ncbi:DUF1702 family protein [Streptomyces sedi]|uniref:DUF1702 family protein n=1 Tax=Streptomyces sedi TaxID=555059 RepID=A0A5C4VEY1_9ACTN|nr:DUF1702 family protein [Streptomyces sedi]TNM34332.1 DUF1702 family protein [Streptomyces sedi]